MNLHRLSWRVGLPFVTLVLAATVTLLVAMTQQVAAETRTRLQEQAAANASFLQLASLPPTERMAEDLRRVTGLAVHFRRGQVLVPAPASNVPAAALRDAPADGRAVRRGDLDVVAVPFDALHALVMARPVGGEATGARLLPPLLAAWGIALVLAWLVGRDLVRPLRNLAAQLPKVDAPSLPDLPEAARRDEIGDVARALRATHTALQGERARRERAEQLAALGRMATALAHEIQNPVAAIKLHAQLLRGPDHGETAAMLEHEATRIEDLLNQWLFLARPAPPATRAVDLRDVLVRCIAQLRVACDHARVTAAVELDEPLLVRADARRLEQVFCNLLRNAVQSMPHGGALRLRGAHEDGSVRVAVEDHGPGFSAEALRRCGELFFSEKEGGMGIGLAVATSIVAAHGGALRAENRPGGGATIHVTLPSIPDSEARR